MPRSLKALAVLLLVLALASCARKPEYTKAPASGGQIRIPIGDLGDGMPVFHSIENGGTTIDYFVVMVNGTVESYFDACAKCYPNKLGYRTEGGDLVCAYCGQRFSMDELKGFGSCHPIPIKGRREGDTYVINRDDLIQGALYF